MSQLIADEGEQVITPTTAATAVNKGAWIDVGAAGTFRIICTVENLSGGTWDAGTDVLTPPTLDWSIEETTDPTDNTVAVTELFAAADFAQVTIAPFPNVQLQYVGIGDRSKVNKRWIRPVWTLGGPSPISTVNVRVENV